MLKGRGPAPKGERPAPKGDSFLSSPLFERMAFLSLHLSRQWGAMKGESQICCSEEFLRPVGAGLGPLAQILAPWRRSRLLGADPTDCGVGPILCGRPAPQNCNLRNAVAPVLPLLSDQRQGKGDLRQQQQDQRRKERDQRQQQGQRRKEGNPLHQEGGPSQQGGDFVLKEL